MQLESIKSVNFKYFDMNGYIYPFEMVEDTIVIKPNLFRCNMYCTATNLTANGEVFLELKFEDDNLLFRTDYFANSIEYSRLYIVDSQSSIYKVNFDKDYLELGLEID